MEPCVAITIFIYIFQYLIALICCKFNGPKFKFFVLGLCFVAQRVGIN